MTGHTAYLRVYEPLAALPEAERVRWQAYLDGGSIPSRPVLMAAEHDRAMAATLAVPPRLDVGNGGDQAYVRHLDGLTYVCPWRLQVRTWEALTDFRSGLPDELSEAFVPGAVAEAAEMEYDAWLATHPDESVGILTSTWQVPVPWFALFAADERRLVLGQRRSDAPAGAPARTGLDRALVYLTAMSRARRRAAKALSVVRRAFADGPAVDALEEIARWLEDFHPHSLVELDYGGLVHLLDDETLSEDTSVAQIAESLESLAAGDMESAGEAYGQVLERWRRLAALEHAN
ncbi:MAG: hypothetical protein QOD07_1963 [Frankiaceae bacterium]|nr:hypothetical protein [Frankiaceae bacterium]